MAGSKTGNIEDLLNDMVPYTTGQANDLVNQACKYLEAAAPLYRSRSVHGQYLGDIFIVEIEADGTKAFDCVF